MKRTVIRRATALTAAAAALTFGFGAGAAEATSKPEPVVTLAPPTTVALPDAPGSAQVQPSWLTSAPNLQLNNVTITIDATRLAGIADVTFNGNCDVVGMTATCTDSVWVGRGTEGSGITNLTLTRHHGAKLGATGSYTITASSHDAKFVGGRGTVTVGGPQFRMSPLKAYKNAPVGSIATEPVAFGNIGDRPAANSEAVFMLAPGVDFTTHYRNCKYASDVHAGHRYETTAVCFFSGPLRIGQQVATTLPLRLKFTSQAIYSYLDALVAPQGDPSLRWVDAPAPSRVWSWGKGAALGLKTLASGKASTAPAGTAQLPGDLNGGSVQLYAHNTADFGVSGSSARAAKGHTAVLHARLFDNGPGALYDRSGGDGSPLAFVTFPAGVSVVHAPANCWRDTQVKTLSYACSSSMLIFPGQSFDYAFTVRVDRYVAHAKGTVQLEWGMPGQGWRPPFESNPGNDSALLHLN